MGVLLFPFAECKTIFEENNVSLMAEGTHKKNMNLLDVCFIQRSDINKYTVKIILFEGKYFFNCFLPPYFTWLSSSLFHIYESYPFYVHPCKKKVAPIAENYIGEKNTLYLKGIVNYIGEEQGFRICAFVLIFCLN